jgi:hypothetical protein
LEDERCAWVAVDLRQDTHLTVGAGRTAQCDPVAGHVGFNSDFEFTPRRQRRDAGSDGGERGFSLRQRAQLRLPAALEAASNQTVLGFARVEGTLRTVSFEAGAFERQLTGTRSAYAPLGHLIRSGQRQSDLFRPNTWSRRAATSSSTVAALMTRQNATRSSASIK